MEERNTFNNAAIFAETPFQLIAGLNIAFNHLKVSKVNLFLTREMYLSNKVFTVNNNSAYVENVYYMKRSVYPKDIASRVVRKIKLLFINEFEYITEDSLPKNTNVDCVIGMKYSTQIVFFLKMYNLKIPAFFYEEGMGDYSTHSVSLEHTKFQAFKDCDYVTEITIYAMLPALYEKINGVKAVSSKTAHEDSFLRCIEGLFINKESLKEIDVLYFDPSLDNYKEEIKDDFLLKQEKVIDKLNCVHNFGIKMHPRSANRYTNINLFYCPWEVLLAEKSINESITIISKPTTAVLSSFFLFNKEHSIIDMSILFKDELDLIYNDTFDKIYFYHEILTEMKALYKTDAKIITPRTFEEFNNIIEELI